MRRGCSLYPINPAMDPFLPMRIGLLRHFPVESGFPTRWITATELHAWRTRYDLSDARIVEFDLGGVPWQTCISSDLPRARITAKTVFNGKIAHTESLREPQVRQFQTGRLRLPFWAWRWILRVSWMTGHRSQRPCRDEFKARVAAVADRLTGMKQDILVVSHAGMMAYLSKELRRRGFSGPSLRIAETAKIYIYERNPLS